jgi:hypothetical protein
MYSGAGWRPAAISATLDGSCAGNAGGHCRSSGVSPAPARIVRAPSTWKSSPGWLAHVRGQQLVLQVESVADHRDAL